MDFLDKQNERVLIVEDSPPISILLKEMLRGIGYSNMVIIESGEEALEFIESNSVDLILMDIHLKFKLNGIQTANIIREKYLLKVIFMTGSIEAHIINEAKKTDPLGFLIKPFDEKHLRVVIEMAINKREIEKKLAIKHQALLQSENKFRLVFENAHTPFIIIEDSIITDCNTQAQSVFECNNRNQLVGFPLQFFIKPTYESISQGVAETLRKTLTLGQTSIEWVVKKQNGKFFLAELELSKIGSESDKKIFCLIRDIDAKRKEEEAVRENERFLKVIIDTIQAGIFLIIPETNEIVKTNRLAMNMLGCSEDDIIGKEFTQYLRLNIDSSLAQLRQYNQNDGIECELILEKDNKVTILLNHVDFEIRGKQYFLISFVDITNQRALLETLRQQKHKIEHQHEIAIRQINQIAEQNKKITDSIIYAQRIQQALFPPADLLKQTLTDYFIIFKPRDIVSGDFYWVNQRNNLTYLAVADCTGHGVPGALMSMLGIAFLNEIMSKTSSQNANHILDLLRAKLIETLRQTGSFYYNNHDGMDMALCIIDHHAMNIKYAGANQPVYLVRDQILTKYKPDKMPIGISFDTLNPFKEKTIEIKPNDMIYLTTDGILDQFGGLDNKKFLSSRFDKMLERISFKSLLEQKEAIVFEFEDWKANFEQVDDILVMGVKI